MSKALRSLIVAAAAFISGMVSTLVLPFGLVVSEFIVFPVAAVLGALAASGAATAISKEG